MLKTEDEVSWVRCLTGCGDAFMSGHQNGSLRVSNKATGRCDQVLRGHAKEVLCIACWEQYLVSGSYDHTIWVWERGGAGSWPSLLRTLTGFSH